MSSWVFFFLISSEIEDFIWVILFFLLSFASSLLFPHEIDLLCYIRINLFFVSLQRIGMKKELFMVKFFVMVVGIFRSISQMRSGLLFICCFFFCVITYVLKEMWFPSYFISFYLNWKEVILRLFLYIKYCYWYNR